KGRRVRGGTQEAQEAQERTWFLFLVSLVPLVFLPPLFVALSLRLLWRRERRRVISFLRADVQRGHTFGSGDLDLHLSPSAVKTAIRGLITKHILILQVIADLRANAFQVVDRARKERTSSGQIRQILEDCPAGVARNLPTRFV